MSNPNNVAQTTTASVIQFMMANPELCVENLGQAFDGSHPFTSVA